MTEVKRHLVALFVAFHVSSVLLLSIPRPPSELARGQPSPELEATLDTWRGAVGPTFDTVEPAIRAGADAWSRASVAVYTFYGPYTRLSGASQGWTMFGTVPVDCERLEIWAHVGMRWELRYAAGSDEATWRRGFFENERIRTFVHGTIKGKRSRWGLFADWALRELSAEDPAVDRVKVQFVRLTIPRPAELARTGHLVEGTPFRVESRALKRETR